MESMLATRRAKKGQAIVETVAGLFVLVPVLLFMVDVSALILGVTSNDVLARNAARSAAGAVGENGLGDESSAKEAAYAAVSAFVPSSWVQPPDPNDPRSILAAFSYNGRPLNPNNVPGAQRSALGEVSIYTTVRVNAPVPFPFFDGWTFVSRTALPIVALEAPDLEVAPAEAVAVP